MLDNLFALVVVAAAVSGASVFGYYRLLTARRRKNSLLVLVSDFVSTINGLIASLCSECIKKLRLA